MWLEKKIPTKAVLIVTHGIEEAVILADRVVVLGRNPGRIRAELTVTLPHYPDRKTPEFQALVDQVYKILTHPELSCDTVTAPAESAAAVSQPQPAPWQQFWTLELPAGAIGLVWNSVMSVAGGWFFLIAIESFTLGDQNFNLPGLGSYLGKAAYEVNFGAICWA